MAYIITDDCISCGACEAECKNEAIKEGESIYQIDAAKCTECIGWFDKPKCVEVRPVVEEITPG
ncbi:MAG: 4Fe-4S binding protein [Chloroflexi bacterium]|nr:4Fe-4S binding protein [Chloroflexota bacterium]